MSYARPAETGKAMRSAAKVVITLAAMVNGYLLLGSWAIGSAVYVLLPILIILCLSSPIFHWLRFRGMDGDLALLLTAATALAWPGATDLFLQAIYLLRGPGSYVWSSVPALVLGSLAPFALLAALGLWKWR